MAFVDHNKENRRPVLDKENIRRPLNRVIDRSSAPREPLCVVGTAPTPPREPSALSAYLRGLRRERKLGAQMDATVAPLVDDVLQAMVELDQRHVLTGGLQVNVNLDHRRKVVAWLVKAFHVVNFDDAILYGCVQLADRYLDQVGSMVSGAALQSIVMACLCTTLKLQTADSLLYSVPQLLAHITHSQISLDRVVKVERDVLNGVNFCVTVPTLQNFLEIYSLRLVGTGPPAWRGMATARPVETVVGGPTDLRPKFYHLADFLCQLTLLNPTFATELCSLVAAAALLISSRALHAPASAHMVLVEDIGHVWNVHNAKHASSLRRIGDMLVEEWCRATHGQEASSGAVAEKFSTLDRHEVARIPPPAVPITF